MKSSFSAGYSSSNRWSFDHHVARKPSVWGEIIARPHLIVAAIGTVALVGLSGTAIWMALPDAPQDTAVAAAAKQKAVTPVAIVEADVASAPAAAPKPAEPPVQKPLPAPTTAMTTTVAAKPAPIPVQPKDVKLLDPQNPRWVDPDADATDGAVPKTAKADAKDGAANAGDPLETAYADDDTDRDAGATAAIPNFKPIETKAEPKADDNDAAKSNGRIIRSVTMRSRPSSRGGVIGTVPAKTQVQVVSCSQWCEIIYKGKRGFIYKSFMSKGSR